MDYANGTTTDRDAWLNNGTGWKVSTSWNSLEPFMVRKALHMKNFLFHQ